MAQHSKERTKAEAQFKQAQKPPPAPPADHGRRTGHCGLRRRGSCCTRKDRTVKGTSVGQRGSRQCNEKGFVQVRAPPIDRRESLVRKRVKASFDPKKFLAKVGDGKAISNYRKNEVVFSQGERSRTRFFTSSRAMSSSSSFPNTARKQSSLF